MYPDLERPTHPRKIQARAWQEIAEKARTNKDDVSLGAFVRDVMKRVTREELAWAASLDANGQPPKGGSDGQ